MFNGAGGDAIERVSPGERGVKRRQGRESQGTGGEHVRP